MNIEIVTMSKPEPQVRVGMSMKEMAAQQAFASPLPKKVEKRSADK